MTPPDAEQAAEFPSLQSFAVARSTQPTAEKLHALRAALAEEDLDGWLVPHADEFQSEDVPPASQRLAWLTGFTGSAGAAVVLRDRAAIFVDGRYTVQVKEQVDADSFEIASLIDMPPSTWLADAKPTDARIGYDPRLHTLAALRRFREALAPSGGTLVPSENVIDRIWSDRPSPPRGAVVPHDERFAGEGAESKLTRLRDALGAAGADALLTNQGDVIAWILNIRGTDTARKPIPLAYLLVPLSGRGTLFIEDAKLTEAARDHLAPWVDVAPLASAGPALPDLTGRIVLIDPASSTEAMQRAIETAGGTMLEKTDPSVLMKAVKNDTELEGARAAHRRDAVAMCRFLAWLEAEGPGGDLDEIAVARQLERFRRETGALKDLSFDTISGAGANAALPHYRVNEATNAPLRPGSVYLVDSGGQYEDGTTDITRTVWIGGQDDGAPDDVRSRFTLVLKGHIAIATARFPEGTSGAQLDTLARHALWQHGLDFAHGTGHGVGSYLGVHEGPQSLSKRGTVPLKPGMIVSNEPGYYREGAYGIRIENLEIVVEAEPVPGGDLPMHRFETLTLAPIDRRLVAVDLLTEAERAWLDAYHARVRREVGPTLDSATAAWLEAATAPI